MVQCFFVVLPLFTWWPCIPQSHHRETICLFPVTYIEVENRAFQSQRVREEGEGQGYKERVKLQRRGLMVLGGLSGPV